MARLWQLMLLLWAWSPLCLSSSLSIIGTAQDCQTTRFVPGYNLGGEGFDIVFMERKGTYVIDTETWQLANGTCKMYRNSYMNGETQKIPAAVVDWRAISECRLEVTSQSFDSAESLANDSTSSVTNDWKIGLELPVDPSATVGVGFGGSHSRESSFAMEKSKEDRFNFFRHSVSCMFYRYGMATNPPLSHPFKSAVDALPHYSQSTQVSYRNLIDTYGTHFITQVFLGGKIKALTSARTCQASMNGLSATEVRDCLSVEASANFLQTASIKTMYKHCQADKKKLGSNRSFSTMFNERKTDVFGGQINSADFLFEAQNPSAYNNWVQSLKTNPDIIKYNLKPLHSLLPRGHLAIAGLKKEVEKYIVSKALVKKCSESCIIGHRSSKRDPCACVCNSNQNVNTNCCPAGKGLATLEVFKLYAEGLYGDVWTQTDGSVKVTYDTQIKRTAIVSNDDNPNWSEHFIFGRIVINMKDRLKFSVYDEDSYWDSDPLGECLVDLYEGTQSDSCMLNHGTLFFSYTVKCAPSLGGSQCQEYIPSPMSPSLAKVFRSRNGVLGEDLHSQFGSGELAT